MKFSIIVPCYNVARYLPKLISSLVAQSHSPDDFEVIFVDDGSTDNTLTDLTELSSQIKFSKVLGQKNAGVSAARNLGIRNASGEWLLFLDADDWYDKDYLTEFAYAIDQYPQLGIFYSKIANFYEKSNKSKVIRGTKPSNIIKKDDNGYLLFDLEAINSLCRTGQAIAVRRDIVLENNIWFPEHIEYGEDFLFHFSYLKALKEVCATRENLEYQSLYIPNVTYYYFKIREERQREHDKFQNDLIYAETVKFEAAYELLVDSNYDANQLAFHFKHLGVSVVYALNLSKNLRTFDQETREELNRYLSILKRWLLLIKDLGLTSQFLEEIKKEKFFTMTRSLPFALFLSALASNPCRVDDVLEFIQEPEFSTVNSTTEEPSIDREEVALTLEENLVVKKSLTDKFLAIFANKKAETTNNSTAVNNEDFVKLDIEEQTPAVTPEVDKVINLDSQSQEDLESKLEATEDSNLRPQFTNQKIEQAHDLDFLYYNNLYVGKKKHLQILTNRGEKFLELLEKFKINARKLSRNIAYRLCGLEVGREFIINLALLNKKEQSELYSLCEDLAQKNFFDYRRGKTFSYLARLLTGSKKHKNYLLYKTVEEKALLTEIARLCRDFEDSDRTFMLNSYDLGYPIKSKFSASETLKKLLENSRAVNNSVEPVFSCDFSSEDKESLAKFRIVTASSNPHRNLAPSEVFHEEVEVAEKDQVKSGIIKLNSIFASYHIRGFIPSDYNYKYKALNLTKLVKNKSGLKGLVKYYMDFANANCLVMTLSQLASRQDCCFNIFTREFPLFDLLVVVDCEVSDYMLTILRSYPNFRLVFPDLDIYKLWLEKLIIKSASKKDLEHGNLDFALYQHNFDLWQVLVRSFVIVDKRK